MQYRGIIVALTVVACLFGAERVWADGINNLDSETRRKIRDVQFNTFSSKKVQSGAVSSGEDDSISAIQSGRRGKRECNVHVGSKSTGSYQRGTKVENITVIDGGVTSVCQ